MKKIDFSQEELDDIFDMFLNNLECAYEGSYEDIDLAKEPTEKFELEADSVTRSQSIILKIDGSRSRKAG